MQQNVTSLKGTRALSQQQLLEGIFNQSVQSKVNFKIANGGESHKDHKKKHLSPARDEI
jgi:hypothetical protein